MATAQRVFWETVTVLVFVVLLGVTWVASGFRAGQRLADAEAGHRQALAALEATHEQALEEVRQSHLASAEAQARAEAEAAFRAYAAGIQPAAVARWRRFLNSTKNELLNEPRVVFVHLMTPEGNILLSTDQSYLDRGRVDESADWARAASELTARPGAEDGVLELAGPILDGGRPVAYLWLGYDVAAAREADAGPE